MLAAALARTPQGAGRARGKGREREGMGRGTAHAFARRATGVASPRLALVRCAAPPPPRSSRCASWHVRARTRARWRWRRARAGKGGGEGACADGRGGRTGVVRAMGAAARLVVTPAGGSRGVRAGTAPRCTVELQLGGGGKADVVALEAWLCCVERVSAPWASKAAAAERKATASSAGSGVGGASPPPLVKGERPLFRARAELLSNALASCTNTYTFELSAQLPASLPPTFMGTSVRYAYYWAAVVTTRAAAASSASRSAPEPEVVRKRLTVMPAESYSEEIAAAAGGASAGAVPTLPALMESCAAQAGGSADADVMELLVLSRHDGRDLLSRKTSLGQAGDLSSLSLTSISLNNGVGTARAGADCSDGASDVTSSGLQVRVGRSMSGVVPRTVAYAVSTPSGRHVMRVLPHGIAHGGVYVLGSTVAGLLDFRQRDPGVICEEVHISLESEEHFTALRKAGAGTSGGASAHGVGGKSSVVRTVHAECIESAADALQTSFVLGLPSEEHAAPSFATAGERGVQLRWVVRFDCLCVTTAGRKRVSETAAWALPITVVAPPR